MASAIILLFWTQLSFGPLDGKNKSMMFEITPTNSQELDREWGEE